MKRFPALALAIVFAAIPAAAQKNKNKTPSPDASDQSNTFAMNDNQKIDHDISEMLAAWQVGVVDEMHKYYSDDVCVVSGAWEQPLFGWDAYAKAYLAGRARTQGGEMNRTNTLIKVVDSNNAWATYQWDYLVTIDGQPQEIKGHTSLVFNKQGDAWLITLNHTSMVSDTLLNRAPSSTSSPAPSSPNPAPQR